MSRLTAALLALACSTLAQGAHAQSADSLFACAPGDPQTQRIVNATFESTSTASASGVLGAEYGTHVRQDTGAHPVSDAECRALITAMGSNRLADTRAVFYRIETSGRQPHVFAAYATLIPSDDPGVAETGEDLVYVLDADYTLLFVSLAVSHDAF